MKGRQFLPYLDIAHLPSFELFFLFKGKMDSFTTKRMLHIYVVLKNNPDLRGASLEHFLTFQAFSNTVGILSEVYGFQFYLSKAALRSRKHLSPVKLPEWPLP